MEKLSYTEAQIKEVYEQLFEAFRYSLQHFNAYQFDIEYNNFVHKLVEIVDKFKLYHMDIDANYSLLMDTLEYIIHHLETAYQLFHIAQSNLDEIMDTEFPMLVEKFDIMQGHNNEV
jgi:hypothetical protein